MLDAPMRKLLETKGKRLKSSQSFTGKIGILEKYRELRIKIETVLKRQDADVAEMNSDPKEES